MLREETKLRKKENKLIFNYKERIVFNKDVFDADFLVDYFYKLRKIENYFDINSEDKKISDHLF